MRKITPIRLILLEEELQKIFFALKGTVAIPSVEWPGAGTEDTAVLFMHGIPFLYLEPVFISDEKVLFTRVTQDKNHQGFWYHLPAFRNESALTANEIAIVIKNVNPKGKRKNVKR